MIHMWGIWLAMLVLVNVDECGNPGPQTDCLISDFYDTTLLPQSKGTSHNRSSGQQTMQISFSSIRLSNGKINTKAKFKLSLGLYITTPAFVVCVYPVQVFSWGSFVQTCPELCSCQGPYLNHLYEGRGPLGRILLSSFWTLITSNMFLLWGVYCDMAMTLSCHRSCPMDALG